MTKTNDEQLTDIAKMLKAADWRDTCDAQWDGLKAIIPHLARELGAAVEPGACALCSGTKIVNQIEPNQPPVPCPKCAEPGGGQ